VSGLGWLAGIVAGALLAAGCSADEPVAEPQPPPAPKTSPVTTASPTPVPLPPPPALPAVARENTKAGAVAFAQHYVDLVNHAAATGEVLPLYRFSSATCKSCSTAAATIEGIYGGGGAIRQYRWTLRRYNTIQTGHSREWLVVLGIRSSPHTVNDPTVDQSRRLAGGNFAISMYVKWNRSGWTVSRMDRSR
jgi:Family of unknown function (DUF6318)